MGREEINKKEDKRIYQDGIDMAADLAVYAANSLIRRLMDESAAKYNKE